jgi:DivIVA domain-containing protein
VALDRQSIEKKDFPVGRRGYKQEAVDAHLSALADEFDELKQSALPIETLGSSASQQVRGIVEAAESSAAAIQRRAEQEAEQIRAAATSDANGTREHAREYVGRVSESTTALLQRIDTMEGELCTLIESLRTGSSRLNAELRLLEGSTEEGGGSSSRPQVEPKRDPEPAGIAVLETASAETSADAEGARLVALNMALNGTLREDTDKYLSENFQLSDRHGLLDEVYASVEG